MAIAPTGAIYKSLSFDGEDSRNYGVYITGEAVYNAPERDVEMITIPGRNGSFALDNGRFENIGVSYPAGIFAENEADFRQAISDFRNFLCSRKGYVRLQDEYNPDEYRMAVYKSGLEVDPAMLRAGEFTITFDCKPQRWLTSGESAVSVTSGDTITNPTLFESSPLLMVEGYGTIEFNEYTIDVQNALIGNLLLCNEVTRDNWQTSFPNIWQRYNAGNLSLMQDGDPITFKAGSIILAGFNIADGYANDRISSASFSISSSDVQCHISGVEYITNPNLGVVDDAAAVIVIDEDIVVDKGTPTVKNINLSGSMQYTHLSTAMSYSGTCTVELRFSETSVSSKKTSWSPSATSVGVYNFHTYKIAGRVDGFSSQSVAGHPLYIDCDMGEAYKIEDGAYGSLNKYIDLGSDLPKLASGNNTITFDNTITDLKIVLRYWKV